MKVRYHRGMRLLATALFVALAACGGAQGPGWPKSAGTERLGDAADDGGESLAPRVPSEVAAVESGGLAAPIARAPEAPATSTAPVVPDSATPPPADGTPQLIELTEEIIITDDL